MQHLFIALTLYSCSGLYLLTSSYFYSGAFILSFYLPLFYFLFTLLAVMYIKKSSDHPLKIRLSFFLLTVGIMYCSASPSSYDDMLAVVIFNTSSMLALSLLVHFLYDYYALLHIKWPYFNSILFMYSFPIMLFTLSICSLFNSHLIVIIDWATLLFFANGLLTIFYILIVGYKRSRKKQLYMIMVSCIMPFSPYVFLYAIPQVLVQPALVDASLASIFFMLLPTCFLFAQFSERILGYENTLSRLRYYTMLAVVTALPITVVVYILYGGSATQIIFLFVIITVILTSFLYIKEAVDFKHRKLLSSASSRIGQDLYTTIHLLATAQSVNTLLAVLQKEITKQLYTSKIHIVKEPITEHTLFTLHTQNNERFVILHRAADEQYRLSIEGQYIKLQHEEMIRLELVAMYSDAFLLHLKQMEQLYGELEKQSKQLPWLQRLVWQYVEKEKRLLAQDLHDTTLQELLHVARSLNDGETKEQLLDVAHELREYCEQLRPTLLDSLGIEAALEKLAKKTNMRANFHVQQSVYITKLIDEQFAIMIYRIVQELYHNALKHSTATYILLAITVHNDHFTIHYQDNNAAIHHQKIIPSMGLSGIEQRIQAYDGILTMNITQQGLDIVISNERKR